MASDGVKFQVNFKTAGGTLINVYAESVVDGIATMNEMAGAADLIRTIEAAFGGAAAPAPVAIAPVVQFPTQPQAAPVTPTGFGATSDGGRQCVHGAMTYRTGNGAKGPWQAYFCPTPKGTPGQCDPQFIR